MPRVIVVAESGGRSKRAQTVLLDEEVIGAHLDDEHASLQFLERLAWAISDAERVEARFRRALSLA